MIALAAALIAASGGAAMAEGGVAGEETPPSVEARLDPVVVTATRTRSLLSDTPQTVSVVTREDMEQSQASTVADVLRDVVGVDVVQAGQRGTQTSVFVRGAEPDQLLVLIDGVQVNSATLASFDFANLTPEGFDRIEVLRGSGGSLYGSEAVAGVINLITRQGAAPPSGTVSVGGGNGSTDRETGGFSYGGEQGAIAGSVTHIYTGGFGPAVPVDESGTIVTHNDDYESTMVSLRGDWKPSATGDLTAIGHFIQSDVGLLNASNFLGVLDPNARQHDAFYFAKLGWEDAPLPGLTYRIDGAFVEDDQHYKDPPDAANPALTKSSIPSQTAQADALATYALGTVSLTTVGFQYTRRAADVSSFYSLSTPPDSIYDVSRQDFGVYGEQQIHLLDDALVAIGSVRYDHDQQFGDVTTPAGAIAGRLPWTGTRLRASYAEGFRAPSFNELYFPHFGNPNLGPERSSEWDAGFDQGVLDDRARVSFTYFDRRVKDDIVTVLVDPATFTFAPENVGRVDAQGVEVSPSVDLGAGLTFGGAYTYLGIRSHGGPGPVLRRPNNLMSAFVNYAAPRVFASADAFNARVDVLFVGDRPDVDPATGAPGTNPQYTRVDLALTYRLPWKASGVALQAFANVQNLFDRSYEEVLGFPALPINAIAGLRATF